jgi:hypothetical protein
MSFQGRATRVTQIDLLSVSDIISRKSRDDSEKQRPTEIRTETLSSAEPATETHSYLLTSRRSFLGSCRDDSPRSYDYTQLLPPTYSNIVSRSHSPDTSRDTATGSVSPGRSIRGLNTPASASNPVVNTPRTPLRSARSRWGPHESLLRATTESAPWTLRSLPLGAVTPEFDAVSAPGAEPGDLDLERARRDLLPFFDCDSDAAAKTTGRTEEPPPPQLVPEPAMSPLHEAAEMADSYRSGKPELRAPPPASGDAASAPSSQTEPGCIAQRAPSGHNCGNSSSSGTTPMSEEADAPLDVSGESRTAPDSPFVETKETDAVAAVDAPEVKESSTAAQQPAASTANSTALSPAPYRYLSARAALLARIRELSGGAVMPDVFYLTNEILDIIVAELESP